jgi:hypothetical protein
MATTSLARLAQLLLGGLLLCAALAAQGQDFELRVTELQELDKQYMTRQRERINELTRRFYGRGCCQNLEELELLQRLLVDRHVREDQRSELQAMGVLLGDVLAESLDMHWVIYEDKVGRSRALRYRDSDNYLFPVTMISRRREAMNLQTVQSIYSNAYDIIDAARPPLPFE